MLKIFKIKYENELRNLNKKKLTKEQKNIEGLISWLKLFYKSNEKDKELILLNLIKKDIKLFEWLNQLRDIGEYDQERLYEQLRMGLYKDEVGI